VGLWYSTLGDAKTYAQYVNHKDTYGNAFDKNLSWSFALTAISGILIMLEALFALFHCCYDDD